MSILRWKKGRQAGCKYSKMKLFSFRVFKLGFDGYILKYDADQVLFDHVDEVEDGNHYRLNLGFGAANFVCTKTIFGYKLGKFTITLFRPDLYFHSLYVFEKTYKLSLGFVKYH